MTKEDKAALVDEIADRLGDAEAIFAVDYRGITVPQAAELRAKLAEAEASFRVVKNRLAKRATERAGTTELDPLFEGPTALAFVKGDAVTAAKAIATFARQHDILAYKGGLMDGAPLEPDQFTTIARLPGLDVLRGQLVGVVSSPLTGLTRGLASMLSGLAVALGEIQERGLVRGEEKAEDVPVGASDEVAEAASEPAAPPEPEPAGNGAEGEASGGDVSAEAASEPAAPPEPEPAGNGAEGVGDDGDDGNGEAAAAAPEDSADEPASEQKAETENAETENDDGSEQAGSEEVEAEGETSEEGQ
jgi:large subunit ribosomal protein L10